MIFTYLKELKWEQLLWCSRFHFVSYNPDQLYEKQQVK